MPMVETPPMKPEDLEKILNSLPEPHYAVVSLFGPFDYSNVSNQVGEIVPGVELGPTTTGLNFKLKDPSKERILNIYRKHLEAENNPKTSKRIQLDRATWYFNETRGTIVNSTLITLTPCAVSVEYHGKESLYVSRLRKALSETQVGFTIAEKN